MKRMLLVLSAVVLGVLSAGAPSAAASPAEPVRAQHAQAGDVGTMAYSDCPRSYSCYWEYNGGTGRRWDAPSCGQFILGDWRNNSFGSVKNGGGGIIHLYDGIYTGYLGSIGIGYQGNLTASQNNRVSSLIIEC